MSFPKGRPRPILDPNRPRYDDYARAMQWLFYASCAEDPPTFYAGVLRDFYYRKPDRLFRDFRKFKPAKKVRLREGAQVRPTRVRKSAEE